MVGKKAERKRTRSRNSFMEILNGIFALLVLGVVVVVGLALFALNRFYAPSDIPQTTTFVVEQGAGLSLTGDRLESQGLISNRYIFQAAGRMLDKQGDLKPGMYNIAAHSSISDVLRALTESDPILASITVPEGFTAWQVVQRLNAEPQLVGELTQPPAEGSILPQTYNFMPGTTREAALKQMQDAQAKVLAEVWAARDPELPIQSPEELVTLASVVEKETGVPTEREKVAAVFVNRLKKGMRLQSDPTIIYGITKGENTLGRGLKRSEIEAKTPYNTYQIDGLPAGPIANPGIDALKAAANPAKTEDLYFVAAGPVPSDGHLFAATYAEHRKNVAKYRQIEQQQANAATAAEADAAKDEIEAEEAKEAGDDAPAKPSGA